MPQAAGAAPELAGLLADMRVANLYLRLLCQYEPRSGGSGKGGAGAKQVHELVRVRALLALSMLFKSS